MSSISSLITPVTFTGQSKFSSDFQTIINRAVQLQSLNLQTLVTQEQNTQAQQNSLQALDQTFAKLQTATTALTAAVGLASYTATLDNPATANVTLSDGATAGTYQLEVQSLGSHTQSISDDSLLTVSSPTSQNISSSGTFTLTVNGTESTITPLSNTLQGLVNAINGNPALGVSASIVNVGSSGSPDYRLAIQATDLGAVSVQLNDGTQDLLNTVSTGTLASYKVDNLPTPITSTSDTITLAPGVTVLLQQVSPPNVPTTITVGQSGDAAQTALQNFATAYNAVVDQLAQSHGSNGNALQGDSILFSANSVLHQINSYVGSGTGAAGLSTIGLDLDKTGHLTFNASEFQATANSGLSNITQFLGDTTSGFIAATSNALDQLENPVDGLLKSEENSTAASITSLTSKIYDQIDFINNYQQNLALQLAQSDAVIAQLESQSSYLTTLFNYNNNNSNGNN